MSESRYKNGATVEAAATVRASGRRKRVRMAMVTNPETRIAHF